MKKFSNIGNWVTKERNLFSLLFLRDSKTLLGSMQIPVDCSRRMILHSVWKSPKMSHLNFSILAFSINFCPIKSGLSGNTVWMVASVSQKLVKLDHFCHFWWIFVHSKCKRSSLRSQCWMRLFGWFSNTVSQVILCFVQTSHSLQNGMLSIAVKSTQSKDISFAWWWK